MTSSFERGADGAPLVRDDLPPALSSMWRLCVIGYQREPALMSVAFALALAAALPDALLALWFKRLGDGIIAGDARLVTGAALGLGVSVAATWLLRIVSTRVLRRFRDKVTIALESHVARLLASIRPSPITSARTTSIGCRCCATRSSCSITCTCRCSRPAGGSCVSASPSCCWRRFTRR